MSSVASISVAVRSSSEIKHDMLIQVAAGTYRAPVVVGPGVLQHLGSCPAELAQALSAVHPLLVKCRSARRRLDSQSTASAKRSHYNKSSPCF